MNIGLKIKELRTEKGLSQAALAKLLVIDPSTIGKYEQNSREPDSKMLCRLADFFDVTVDYLLGRED